MNYNLNGLFQQLDLIGQRCWYKVPYKQDLTFSKIKEVDTAVTDKGKAIYLTLQDGTIAVLHTHDCPCYIGRDKVWGFLSQEECNRYWDM